MPILTDIQMAGRLIMQYNNNNNKKAINLQLCNKFNRFLIKFIDEFLCCSFGRLLAAEAVATREFLMVSFDEFAKN